MAIFDITPLVVKNDDERAQQRCFDCLQVADEQKNGRRRGLIAPKASGYFFFLIYLLTGDQSVLPDCDWLDVLEMWFQPVRLWGVRGLLRIAEGC